MDRNGEEELKGKGKNGCWVSWLGHRKGKGWVGRGPDGKLEVTGWELETDEEETTAGQEQELEGDKEATGQERELEDDKEEGLGSGQLARLVCPHLRETENRHGSLWDLLLWQGPEMGASWPERPLAELQGKIPNLRPPMGWTRAARAG